MYRGYIVYKIHILQCNVNSKEEIVNMSTHLSFRGYLLPVFIMMINLDYYDY